MQLASENSHRMPLTRLLSGQGCPGLGAGARADARCRIAWPLARASALPPTLAHLEHVGIVERVAARVHVVDWQLRVTDEHGSNWPISCSMSTPASSAVQGTWLCYWAVMYSAWKSNGVPVQSAKLEFM